MSLRFFTLSPDTISLNSDMRLRRTASSSVVWVRSPVKTMKSGCCATLLTVATAFFSVMSAGRYRLDGRLGAGGMGVVYQGETRGSGASVAVKFLHDAFAGMPDLVKRFEREVAAMRRIDHPNLVGIVDSGVEAGVPYLVMDFQSGQPLGDVVDQGALAPARAVGIA